MITVVIDTFRILAFCFSMTNQTSSSSKSTSPQESAPSQTGNATKDAFLYYSNDAVRMKTLKMEEVSEEEKGVAVERKQRLSFELHPSLVLEDLISELVVSDAADNFVAALYANGNYGETDQTRNFMAALFGRDAEDEADQSAGLPSK